MFTTVQTSVSGVTINPKNIQQVACTQIEGKWYLAMANYIWQKGQRISTEIAAYTDELLEWVGRKRKNFTLLLNTIPFEGAKVLELDEFCTDQKGGAYYYYVSANSGKRIRLWVCDTSLLVFGDLPPRIYFRSAPNKCLTKQGADPQKTSFHF